jgi:hypothetical protein
MVAMIAAAAAVLTRNINATSSVGGKTPSCFDAMQSNAVQCQRDASGSFSIFGSFIASS